MKISFYEKTGKGYENGWWTNCHCRYRCFKGGRNTKKSYVIVGLEVINKILTDERRNVLMIRNILSSQRTSTFTTICMLIDILGLSRYFKINNSDMTITYLATKQVILFKGMDDPQKIQSIRVKKGYLTDVYIEEAFELKDFESWRKVDGSIRGKLPKGLFFQITFCFNAWRKKHWLYEHFFKGRMEDNFEYLLTHQYQDWCDPNLIIDYGRGLYLHTSTFKINEFRDKEIYDLAMEELRKVAPEIFKVEALGMWGNSSSSTYPEFNESLIINPQEIFKMGFSCYAIGIDTGLSDGEGNVKKGKDVKLRSATTMQLVGITNDYKTLVAIDEYFYSNENEFVKKTEPQLQTEIIQKLIEWQELYGYGHPDLFKGITLVYVDCADKGFRQGLEVEAKRLGLNTVRFLASSKSVRIVDRITFIRRIMAYGEYKFSSNCKNLIREISNARQDEEKGLLREDIDDHATNANEYAWIPIINNLKRWANYKKQG